MHVNEALTLATIEMYKELSRQFTHPITQAQIADWAVSHAKTIINALEMAGIKYQK
jgi:hypothetical protein